MNICAEETMMIIICFLFESDGFGRSHYGHGICAKSYVISSIARNAQHLHRALAKAPSAHLPPE